MKTHIHPIDTRISLEHSAQRLRILCSLASVIIGLLLAFVSPHSWAKEALPVRDCCGDENYVYHPSTERIKITNSAEVTKQIATSRENTDESVRLGKAIKLGNLVLQARINSDLFRIGYEQDPPEIREGWRKHYAPYISVDAPELLRILEAPLSERRVSKNLAPGGMVCPFARLDKVEVLPNKTFLTYQFVHIARSAGMFKGIGIVDYPLELVDKGKIGTYRIALNREFKYVPNDPDTDWWTAYTTKAFKESLTRHIKSNYGPDQQYKPKLRELLTQITDAEKVCNQKNLGSSSGSSSIPL